MQHFELNQACLVEDEEQESEESDNNRSNYSRNLRKKIKKSKQKIQSQPIQTMTYAQRIRECYRRGDLKELVAQVEKDKGIFQEYDEIKVNKHTLKLGQNALIKNGGAPSEDYVGKILRIMTIKEQKSSKMICLCEVQWYYRKNEIMKSKQNVKWVSVNEVFKTSCRDVILASSINQPCVILSLDEYENVRSVEKGTFFTRLGWNPKRNQFDGLNKEKVHCTCKMPLNPDLLYIQCDKCDKWYHTQCVGLKKGEYEGKEYICGCCR